MQDDWEESRGEKGRVEKNKLKRCDEGQTDKKENTKRKKWRSRVKRTMKGCRGGNKYWS